MDGAYTVTDPTDWLPTSLPKFSSLENSLRCQVCKDFFNNPVITSCSHTFCSLCIRRCLSAEGKCPACRAGDQASKLRRNWAIEEVVATFISTRPDALRIATADKDEREERPTKRRRVQREEVAESTGRQTRRSARNAATPSSTPVETIDVDDDDDDADYDPEPDDGLVSCPMCSARMKEEAVFPHLDRCDGSKPKPKPVAKIVPVAAQRTTAQQERLPELNYSLLGDGQMRKKLKELGIPAVGAKALMVRRHTEWVNLWNANCDAARPKSKRELLHELDIWERAQGAGLKEGGGGIMKKDFDAEGWKRNNKEDFGRLIQEARERAKRKATETGKKEEEEKVNGVEKEGTEDVNGVSAQSGQGESLFAKAVESTHQGPGSGSPPKKVPMFQMPAQPVADVEMGQGTAGD
ncbi:DNA repair protein rad18 [Myriangium duriaei CBS 260.36]|uniref:Postreplication repair E3 ubiquitin-protein ligase RAD18 n=1 Tax=Myriangium duriaei CBS 260.36 TaxID=1168546 RepID=A0A9P4J3G5_9PEZI|nr:DNA repair protein rad18 [Myriangium duriaei CBS 260.36]